MKKVFTFLLISIDARLLATTSLISILCLLPVNLHAEDKTAMTPMPLISSRPSNTGWANAERNDRLHLLLDYVRHQGPALVPGLPDALRGPTNYLMRQMRSASDVMGFEESGTTGSLFSFIHPGDDDTPEALWLSPGYHHTHGMLPFDDALMLGFHYRNAMMDDQMKFDIHPFIGQSWNSGDSYWGIETAVALGEAAKPWGKIVLRYDNGSSNLMDRGHGIDVHTDLSFDDHLTLSAGARQNEEGGLGNYALVRWRMKFGE